MGPIRQHMTHEKERSTRVLRAYKENAKKNINQFIVLSVNDLTTINDLAINVKDYDKKAGSTKRTYNFVGRLWEDFMIVNGVAPNNAWTSQYATLGKYLSVCIAYIIKERSL